MYGYIYKFTNLVTNKIYIGKREKSVFDESYYGSGKLWRLSMAKIDKTQIKREVLEWCESREQLRQQEKYWIAFYNSTDRTIGYNIHEGGVGGNSLNDTKAWSDLHRGDKNGRYGKEVTAKTRAKIGDANRGRKYSDEINKTKGRPGVKKPDGFGEKISKAQKGRRKGELELEHLRAANLRAAEKNRGKHIYNNGVNEIRLREGELIPSGFVRGRLPKISDIIRGQNHSGKNNAMYGKKHSDESKRKMSEVKKVRNADKISHSAKAVQCVETGTIYPSIKLATQSTGLTTISACCRGVINECKKNHTHWRFIDEDKINK